MFYSLIILWGALCVFLIDLSAMERINKYDEVWWFRCHDLSKETRLLCMIDHNVAGIVVSLAVLMFLTYKLMPIYKKQLLWTPLLGLLTALFIWPIIQAILYMF